MPAPSEPLLRAARATDAGGIARVLRAATSSFDWMPVLHTPADDLAFVEVLLSRRSVTVAEVDHAIVGFVAVGGEWVDQLYLDPTWTGQGIGSRLLAQATDALPLVRLYCFQANLGARRFYERHGFRIEAFGDGSKNEEGLPDILSLRSAKPPCSGVRSGR